MGLSFIREQEKVVIKFKYEVKEMEKLLNVKPCPFCGYTNPFLVKEKDYDANIHDSEEKVRKAEVWFHVVCLKCKVKTQEESNRERAIARWEQRE